MTKDLSLLNEADRITFTALVNTELQHVTDDDVLSHVNATTELALRAWNDAAMTGADVESSQSEQLSASVYFATNYLHRAIDKGGPYPDAVEAMHDRLAQFLDAFGVVTRYRLSIVRAKEKWDER